MENRISRPAQGLPRQWLADWKDEGEDEAEEEEQEPVVVERRGRGRRRPAAVEPEVRRVSYYEDDDDYLYDDFEDYEEDEYEGYGGRTRGGKGPVRPPAPLAASDDFPATFSESEPGFFPLFVRSLSHAVQEVSTEREGHALSLHAGSRHFSAVPHGYGHGLNTFRKRGLCMSCCSWADVLLVGRVLSAPAGAVLQAAAEGGEVQGHAQQGGGLQVRSESQLMLQLKMPS